MTTVQFQFYGDRWWLWLTESTGDQRGMMRRAIPLEPADVARLRRELSDEPPDPSEQARQVA